ncbi:MAG: hypothetical protein RSC07_03775 [Mucinivorans sp.]
METLSIILNFILGSGLLGTLLFWRSRHRQEQAQAGSAEISNRQKEFELQSQALEFLQKQLSEAYTELDKMQQIINEKREQLRQIIQGAKQLEMDLLESQSKLQKSRVFSCSLMECAHRKECVV